jgi:hypothetical protein
MFTQIFQMRVKLSYNFFIDESLTNDFFNLSCANSLSFKYEKLDKKQDLVFFMKLNYHTNSFKILWF